MPGYSKRVPRALLVALKPDRYYFRSKKALLRQAKTLPNVIDDRWLARATESLLYSADTDIAWLILAYREAPTFIVNSLGELAASIGNYDLMRMILWRGSCPGDCLINSTAFEHWKVLELLLPYQAKNNDLIRKVAAISPAAYRFLTHLGYILGSPQNLHSEAVANRYRYGFDQEILDFYCKEGTAYPIRDTLSILGPYICAKYHKSALETLRYLLGKFPNVIWTKTDMQQTLFGAEFTSPEIEREFRAMLAAAGHPNTPPMNIS